MPDAHETALDRRIFEEGVQNLAIFVLDAFEARDDGRENRAVDIAVHTADIDVGQDHAAAGGLLEDVEHALAQTPRMHEEALEAERVGGKAHPEQV